LLKLMKKLKQENKFSISVAGFAMGARGKGMGP